MRKSHRKHRRRSRRHSNPSLRAVGSSFVPVAKGGLIGALGGLGLDVLWGKLNSMLPASVQGSAPLQYAVKILGAVAVGYVGNIAMKGKGRELAAGAATVVLHDAMKATLQSSAPATFGPGGTLGLGLYLSDEPGLGLLPIGSGGDIVQNGIRSVRYPPGSGEDLVAEGNSGATRGSGIDLVAGGISGFETTYDAGAGESDIG